MRYRVSDISYANRLCEADFICDLLLENEKNFMLTMKKADCKDQICADHKAIEKSGETIVCLPHKVVIEIRSEDGKEQELDGVTQ